MRNIQQIDDAILAFIQNNMHLPALDVIMPVISMLGSGAAIWVVITIILLITKKYRTLGISMAVALTLCFLIGNCMLKPLVARPRPFDLFPDMKLLISRPGDFSFPSGHTMSSFAAASVIFIKNKRWGTAALVLACLIAFSRLYLFVHYPSDVVTGMILGVGAAFLAVRINERSKKASVKQPD